MPKDRGAEQGDVGGHLERSLPRVGVDDPSDFQRLQADHATRVQESASFQLGGLEKLTGAHDPRHALQKSGGLADQWYMDDGDILCHQILVPTHLQEFDVFNAKVGAERNPQKTESHPLRERLGCSAS